jgi:hypothetical protein
VTIINKRQKASKSRKEGRSAHIQQLYACSRRHILGIVKSRIYNYDLEYSYYRINYGEASLVIEIN